MIPPRARNARMASFSSQCWECWENGRHVPRSQVFPTESQVCWETGDSNTQSARVRVRIPTCWDSASMTPAPHIRPQHLHRRPHRLGDHRRVAGPSRCNGLRASVENRWIIWNRLSNCFSPTRDATSSHVAFHLLPDRRWRSRCPSQQRNYPCRSRRCTCRAGRLAYDRT